MLILGHSHVYIMNIDAVNTMIYIYILYKYYNWSFFIELTIMNTIDIIGMNMNKSNCLLAIDRNCP